MKMDKQKTPGQLAYEEDVRLSPTYQDGTPRLRWDQLDEVRRWSWERNATPRQHHKQKRDRDQGMEL
jgi:hypothetical protein